jgi:hypothetical protein
MPKDKKTTSEHVLDALIDNKTILLSDITKLVSKSVGKEVKIQNISSLMARLSNPGQFQTGHFIIRTKTPNGFEYSLVPEILALAPEEIYDLTRKVGKDRFTLEMAIEKIPELAQYVKKTGKSSKKAKSSVTKKIVAKKPAKKKASAGKKKSSPWAVKGKSKAKAGEPKTVKGKPGRKPAPKPIEPEIQKANIDDLVAGFLNELERMGGMKVNYYLTVRLEK